jgi:hypothetical protein
MVKRFLDVYITIAEKEEHMDHFNPWMQTWTCEIPFPQLTYIIIYIYIEILKTTHTCINRKTPTGRVYVLWADSPRRGISRCWTLAGCLGGSARRFFTNDILQAQFPFQDMPGVSISNFYPCKITRLKRQSHIFGFNNRHFEL